MNRADSKLLKSVAKGCVGIVLMLLLCKLTAGVGAVILALGAVMGAFAGRLALSLSAYCLFSFMVIMSGFLLPKTGLMGMVLRLAPWGLTAGLLVSSGRRTGSNYIPIGLLWAYLAVACLSSATGYNPPISYLKILNFGVLLAGIHLGLRNIDRRPAELDRARMFVLSLIFFMVVGSLATLPFPGIAYSTSVGSALREEGLDAANELVSQIEGPRLFAGLTGQSQALGIMVPCALAWLLCDMLFIEGRMTFVHMVAIAASFPMLYMCRSRTAFVAGCVAIIMVCGYAIRRIQVPQHVRNKIKKIVQAGVILLVCVMTFMEVKDRSISKFLRKYDAGNESVGMAEALTKTRMGKVEENMADFKENPLLGTGFQVVSAMKGMTGFRLSAPIEKSVLPLMVLGETGIVGELVFLAFLCVFYGTCARKCYYCTMTMMTTFLATNLSEATFFSPGGVGGVMWIFCGVGGFVNDMIIRNRRRNEMNGMGGRFW